MNPIMPPNQYRSVMGQLSNQYDLLKENPGMNTMPARNLMYNLNPTVNPGSSQAFLNGLERRLSFLLLFNEEIQDSR